MHAFWRRDHVHVMLPIRTQAVGDLPMPGVAVEAEARVRATAVLRRCSCGAFDSVVIVGSWALADLLGASERESVENLIKGA